MCFRFACDLCLIKPAQYFSISIFNQKFDIQSAGSTILVKYVTNEARCECSIVVLQKCSGLQMLFSKHELTERACVVQTLEKII